MAVARRHVALLGIGEYYNAISNKLGLVDIVPIDAAYEASGLPATNLGTKEPTEISRLLSLDPRKSRWQANPTAVGQSIPIELSGFALVNHNLSPWGLWRVRGTTSYNRFRPSSMSGSFNVTGVVGNIDDTDLLTPDAAVIGPTAHNGDWATLISMDSMIGTTIYDTQCHVVAWLYGVNTGVTDYLFPRFEVDLYENGVFKAQLGARAITKPAGQMLIFTFDSSLINTALSHELYIRASPGSSISGVSYATLDAIQIYAQTTAPLEDYDTGYISTGRSTSPNAARFSNAVQHDSFFPDAPTTAFEHIVLELVDDQTDHFDVDAGWALQNPSTFSASILAGRVHYRPTGYVQAGVWMAGTAFFLAQGLQGAPVERIMETGREGMTDGGQPYAGPVFRRRGFSANFMMTEDEKNILMDALDWQLGMTDPFFVATMADVDHSRQRFNSGYVVLEELGDATMMGDRYVEGGDETQTLYMKSYTFGERL